MSEIKWHSSFQTGLQYLKSLCAKPQIMLPLLVVLAALIELFIFNSWAWYDRDAYQRQEVTLPAGQGKSISSTQRVLTIEDIKVPIQNIYFELQSSQPQIVSVMVMFKDYANKDRFVGTNAVILNAGGECSQRFVHFDAHKGELLGLQLIFTPSTNTPLYLSKLVFNEDEPLKLSVLRLALMAALFMGCYCLWQQRWYCYRYTASKTSHRVLDYGVLGLALAFAVLLALLQLNALSSLNAQWLMSHSSGKSSAALLSSMRYLIGLNLGLALLVIASSLLAFRTLVRYFAPEPNIILYVLSQFALVVASLVYYQQNAFLSPNQGALLCQLGLALTVIGTYGGHTQKAGELGEPELSTGRAWGLQLVTASMLGLGLILVAWCNPWALVMVLALTAASWRPAVRSSYNAWIQYKSAKAALPQLALGVLCVLLAGTGLILGQVAGVNVAQLLQGEDSSALATAAGLSVIERQPMAMDQWWSLTNWGNALFYYVFETLTYSKLFPWVEPTTTAYYDHAEGLVLYERVSLMSLPMLWALALCLLPWKRLLSSAPSKGQHQLMALVLWGRISLLALVLWVYLTYIRMGVSALWASNLIFVGALLAALFIMRLVPMPESNRRATQEDGAGAMSLIGCTLYGLCCFFLIKTIVIGLTLVFAYSNSLLSGSLLWQLDPDLLLQVAFFFDSFNF